MRRLKISRKWWIEAFCIAAVFALPISASPRVILPDNSGLDMRRSVPRTFIEGMLGTAERETVRGAFFDAKGKEFVLEDFKDKVLVLVFWAHWSLDSLTLLGSIQRVKDYIASTDTRDMIEVLPIAGRTNGVSYDEIEKICAEHGLKMPIYFDKEGALFDYFAVRSVPLTLIADREGRTVYRIEGYMKWDSIAVVRQLLAIATRDIAALPS